MKRDTDERIIKAAIRIFSKCGWQAATTLEIARAARVNEVTLFRRFGNKSQIFKEVIQRTVVLQAQALQRSIDEDLPLEQAIKLFANTLFKSLMLKKILIRSMIGEEIEVRKQVVKSVRETVEPVMDQFTFFLKKCQKRGEISGQLNCEILRESFTNSIFSFVIKTKIRERDYTVKEYLDSTVKIFVQGVKP